MPLGGSEVVLPVSEGLLDGCGLCPGLVGDSDADALAVLGVLVPAVLVAAGDDPGIDGLGVAVLTDDPAVGAAVVVLLGASGCRICSICCSYRCSCAWISARLSEVRCWPKARTCSHRAASCAAVEPDGAAGNERSSWIAIAAVRQLVQL